MRDMGHKQTLSVLSHIVHYLRLMSSSSPPLLLSLSYSQTLTQFGVPLTHGITCCNEWTV